MVVGLSGSPVPQLELGFFFFFFGLEGVESGKGVA